jgi:hypothetical protein
VAVSPSLVVLAETIAVALVQLAMLPRRMGLRIVVVVVAVEDWR